MKVAATRRALVSLFVLTLLCRPGDARAASGTEAAAFLDIPIGARPAALGGAYSAMDGDGYSPVFNPAALGALDAKRLSLTHLDHLEADYEFAGYAHPLASRAHGLGAAVQFYRPGRISGFDAAGTPTGDVSGHYGAYTLGYGMGVGDWVAVGASGKVVRAAIDGVTATAYAADLGALYRPSKALSLALVAANLGNKLKFMDQGDELPRTLRAGANWKPMDRWSFVLEGLYAHTGLGAARAGAEWKPIELVALRLGYKSETVEGLSPLAGLSTGVGVLLKGHEFSYAWVPHGDLGFTQHFSLAFKFGGAASPSEASLPQAPLLYAE